MESIINLDREALSRPVHPWLKQVKVCFHPGPLTPLSEEVVTGLLKTFQELGHEVQESPDNKTDLILTTASFGEPIPWREALLFSGRRQLNLAHLPTIVTLIHMTPDQFEAMLAKFDRSLAKEIPDPDDYDFPGLAPDAYRVLHEQGRRGGPILALERLTQAHAKSIRNLLLIGDGRPERIYHFDLVGAHPQTNGNDLSGFYEDIVLRIATAVSTQEITDHQVVDPPIPKKTWRQLSTPKAMLAAARQIGSRNFFTDTVVIGNLIHVPALSDSIAGQYSEGCFTTWDPEIEALIATVTGSARPVDKGSITQEDLAVIVGIRPDGRGAHVRQVEGWANDPPPPRPLKCAGSTSPSPRLSWIHPGKFPARCRLSGQNCTVTEGFPHSTRRGSNSSGWTPPITITRCRARPRLRPMASSPRSPGRRRCGTLGTPASWFLRFSPGHGVMIAEKWIPGKAPFQTIWEHMDSGSIVIDNHIPQGLVEYRQLGDGKMHLL